MVLLTALLVACGATATAVPQDQPEPTIARPVPLEIKPTSAPPPTMVVSTRDTLRFLTSEEPTTIGAASPNCGGNLQNTICDDMASDPLTWIDTASFQVVPMTGIESWEQRDPRRWRFKLRDGVKFHNGAPWNAEQAKFWIDFFGDEQTSGHNNSNDFSFHGVMGGEVVDPLTLDVVCKNACPILPRTTIFTKFQDVGWFKTATPADIERNTVGLGPYKIVEWRAGVQVELEAFKDYKPNKAYDSQAPSIKRVIQMWRNEPLVRASMMATGEADWAEISFEDRNRVAKWKSGTNNEVSLYAIDTVHHPELRKKEVREALNLAIDCKTLMAKLYDNLMECYGNTAQTGTVGITPQNSAPYGYNPARARLLLKQAGYNPANKITLSIRSQRVPKDVEYAEAAVTYWREVGINADLAVLEASQWNTVSRSNCGHMRTRAELQNAPGADLHEKCRSLGAGPPRFSSMNLSGTATSTESLDFSRHAVQRNSCYSRTSGVCFGDLEKLIEEASATDTGPLRAQRLQAIADRAHNEFYFVPVTQVVAMYALSKNLEWQPNYAPRVRANTMRFTK
jgi:ABC-type transport system substrate-binding protein